MIISSIRKRGTVGAVLSVATRPIMYFENTSIAPITYTLFRSGSKFAPKTKFMRAQDLLRGLLRKNHAAKKDLTNMDKGELGMEDPQSGSEAVSWTVKCDDCGFQAENITSLATHKKTNHVRLGEE